MADKMREIFGDDSDSDDSKSQEEEEEEEQEQQEDNSNDEEQDNASENNNQQEESANEEEDEEEEEEEHNEIQETEEVAEEEEEEENQNNNNNSAAEENKSDSDNDDKQQTQVVEAVFGDELADLSEDSDIENINQSQTNKSHNITDDNEEHEPEPEPEHIINVEIPRIKSDLGKEMHFIKLPNFLSIEAKPFNRETYEDESGGTDAYDEEGKQRVKLKVENTIRWRNVKDEDGNVVRESNARMVRWSDGSLSFHLGNEIFDVYKQYMQGDHNHLFIRQGTGLQGQGVFRTKLAFRPHSTDSLTHRKMTMSLVDSGSKQQKVKILTEGLKNPDEKRADMIKKEEEKLRAISRRENHQRRVREKSHAKGLSAGYLEDKYSDEEESAISLSAIKSKYKSGGRNDSRNSINSSGDESDRERRLNKAKSYDDDSDSERNQMKKKKKVVADDDE